VAPPLIPWRLVALKSAVRFRRPAKVGGLDSFFVSAITVPSCQRL